MENLGAQDPRWIGEYRLLGKLGEGGMGKVFLARSARGRTVAVKLVQAELARQADFRGRFQREVEAARRVGGQWTAPVLDADTNAEVPWVATGYIGGPSLHDVVAEGFGALPEHSVRVLAHGLSLALRDIHGAGLVHRDLKPSNILITIDGPRVIDFGIARALDAVDSTVGGNLTMTGAVVGSPGFMSPEQVRGEVVTAASDVFCLGSVLAFAATGRQPFGSVASGIHALMYRIAQEEPDLTGLPEGLHGIVSACLNKDAALRPSVADLVAYTERTGPESETWLPGELLARLGRDALQLLEVETENAQQGPVGPHATAYAHPAAPSTPTPPTAHTGHAPHSGYATPSAYGSPPHAGSPGYPVTGVGAPAPQYGQPWPGGHQTPFPYQGRTAAVLRSARGLCTGVLTVFGIWIVLTVIHLYLNLSLFGAYRDLLDGSGTRAAVDHRKDAVEPMDMFLLFSAVAVLVMWLVWFRRVYLNATVLAPGRQRFSSGYAVGSWFIPVAQLWQPKQIANDIWNSSVTPGPGRVSRSVLHWWWTLFVAMFWIEPITGLVELGSETDKELQVAAAFLIVDDIVSLLCAVLALTVVVRITRMQEQRSPGPAGRQPAPPAGMFGPPAGH
ncbi:protein kinase domain-containing protein [Streptomyces cucumeris]|uniref:protein kinase domain-containing protein n=1 Tax=Streptomyces cucumeris TaxID=2962890 RepID=UPI003D71DAAC